VILIFVSTNYCFKNQVKIKEHSRAVFPKLCAAEEAEVCRELIMF